MGDVVGLEHARVRSVDLPDGRLASERPWFGRIILIGAVVVLFAMVPVIMFVLLSLPQRFGFTLGRGATFAAGIASVAILAIAVSLPVLVWVMLLVRMHTARWRETCASIAAEGDADVADALRKACGESGPNASWGAWRSTRRRRWPAGELPAPMTIVSRQLVPDIAAIAPTPGLLEPEAVVQTVGRGARTRRILLGVCGALMMLGLAGQLPMLLSQQLSPRAFLVVPQFLFGVYFLFNAMFGLKLSRWRADRAGPGDAPYWCGPGWVRWHYARGTRATWHRHNSVMVVLASGAQGPIQLSEVRVTLAGPEGTCRLGFDGVDGEFARLWRAWTSPSVRDPDTGAPMDAASASRSPAAP